MAYKKTIVVTIKDGDGKVVAVDQMPLPPNSTTDLVSEIEIVDVPSRPRRDDRSPLSPDALRLADLRVGMRIRVNHKNNPGWSYSAMVVGSPTTNEYGNIVIPLVKLGEEPDYITGYPEDMGLMRYVTSHKVWNPTWYVTAE